MKAPSLYRLFLLLIAMSLCLSCKGPLLEDAPTPEVSLVKSGDLELKSRKNSPRTIYVDVRDATGNAPLTPEVLPAMLEEDNYEVVDNPSEAAYILHVSLLAEGRTDPALLKELVNNGYDSEAKFAGDGVSAWLVDALLVQRKVPEASRESQVRLQNISARNAIGNSQMRLAVSTPDMLKDHNEYVRNYVHPVAQAIREAMGNKARTDKKTSSEDAGDKPKKQTP